MMPSNYHKSAPLVSESIKLLVVDDDDVDRTRIRRLIDKTSLNVIVSESSNILDSISLMRDCDYDCVIVDYCLGIEDGLTLLHEIRNTLGSQCAIIMITGLGDEKVAAEALRRGANDYLLKRDLASSNLLHSIVSTIHQKELEREVQNLAHYDELTGLVSRHLLLDRLQQTAGNIERSQRGAALAFIDLDNFKPVNDMYGHDAGDEVLVEVSNRFKNSLRATDTIARIGGDEFVLLFPEMSNAPYCEDLLSRLLLRIQVPIALSSGNSVRVSASIGVAMVTDSSLDADTILRRADQMMYKAKNSGKNKVIFFDPEEEQRQKERRNILTSLRSALRNDEFVLFYQPKVNLISGQCLGVEALIRWNHPVEGLLSPARFEEGLNHSDLAVEIGEWVIEQSIKQHQEWKAQGINLKVSVNVSPAHIHQYDFIDRLDHLLEKFGSSSECSFLEFEVLESVSLKNIDHSVNVLKKCRERGIRLAIDDFGTGYASLKYLKLLPLDIIKIDRSFTSTIDKNQDDIAIVKSIIALSSAFEYQLIAEGVETITQAKKLIELGCSNIQGYLLSKPVDNRQLAKWYKRWFSGRKQQPLLNEMSKVAKLRKL